MKFFAAVALLALFAVAFAQSQPVEPEKKIEPVEGAEQVEPKADGPRDKRGVLLGAAYTAPLAYTAPVAYTAYSAYSSPYVYSAGYPYAYSYRAYPYVYNPYY